VKINTKTGLFEGWRRWYKTGVVMGKVAYKTKHHGMTEIVYVMSTTAEHHSEHIVGMIGCLCINKVQ
jgi:hypothetical protein